MTANQFRRYTEAYVAKALDLDKRDACRNWPITPRGMKFHRFWDKIGQMEFSLLDKMGLKLEFILVTSTLMDTIVFSDKMVAKLCKDLHSI